jgi:hypothetical protein
MYPAGGFFGDEAGKFMGVFFRADVGDVDVESFFLFAEAGLFVLDPIFVFHGGLLLKRAAIILIETISEQTFCVKRFGEVSSFMLEICPTVLRCAQNSRII